MGRDRDRKSRSRSRRRSPSKSRRQPAKRSSPSPSSEDDTKAGSGGNSVTDLKVRVELLEVDNEKLKAENKILRKKLAEAIRNGGSTAAAATVPEPAAGAPADRRLARLREQGSAAGEDTGGSVRERRRTSSNAQPEPGPAEDDEPPPDEMRMNAVQLCNNQMEVYNAPVPNNIPLEKRLPMVQQKMDSFLQFFADSIQIMSLKPPGVVIKDMKTFKVRYQCVFRESGSSLKGECKKRFYFDSVHRPTYCLDWEVHEKLVTALAGTKPDGSLGVRDPRTEHLVVLYEEKNGKIARIWLMQDKEKLGSDPYANEDILSRSEIYKEFEKKIAELRGGQAGPRIFHNYHES
eukprot:gnl/TRDRNA2_/TRDRNA2_35185_c0_seq1.p1 gnl/TRDRNA2_/TRDRNA2_35185_c0~~gnl/TRDRNA2_/TRDRNA2_35185_c0_seq1.p1  ORF type:complete len:348 (+),score=67.55 gnl/TRDRNA2_/TRDRNA2_35185_c0_seq1:40-1083(+)